MESLTKKAFSVNLKLMWILRLYTFEKPTKLFKLQTYFLYVTFLCTVPCLGVISVFTQDNINVDRSNYDFTVLAELTSFILKYLPFISNGERIMKCINYFGYSTLSRDLNSKQENIVEECVKICRRNTLVFSIIIIGALVAFSFRPLFWDGYVLPIDIWLPFDVTSGPYIFYLTHIFVASSFTYMAMFTIAADPLIAGLACLVTGHLKILQDKLQFLDIDNYSNSVSEETRKSNLDKAEIIYKQIQNCVDRHNEIKLFTEEFEKCFSPCIFYQILAAVLVICFACLQVIRLQTIDITTIYQMSCCVFGVVAQIYFYCYYGSTIFDEVSNNLTNAIYMGNWYDYNAKSRKALSILMASTQIPIKVTSGKIFDLSLDTFALVFKRSYSLIAVLKDFN